jgi:hypothetical protein
MVRRRHHAPSPAVASSTRANAAAPPGPAWSCPLPLRPSGSTSLPMGRDPMLPLLPLLLSARLVRLSFNQSPGAPRESVSIPSGPTVHAVPLHPLGQRHCAVVSWVEVGTISQAPWPPHTLPSRMARAHSNGQPCMELTFNTDEQGEVRSTSANDGATPVPSNLHSN